MKLATKIAIGTFIGIVAVAGLLIFMSSRSVNAKRNALAHDYSQSVILPAYMSYTGRTAEGDGLDSQPYWYYSYRSSRNPEDTLAGLGSYFNTSGYKLSDTENSHTPGVDPKTTYEFVASKQALHLIVAIQKDSTVQITVARD